MLQEHSSNQVELSCTNTSLKELWRLQFPLPFRWVGLASTLWEDQICTQMWLSLLDQCNAGLVRLFTLWKSVQGLKLASAFLTRRHGEAQLNEQGSAMPLSSMYCTSASNCRLLTSDTWYKHCLMGSATPTSMSCSIKSVWVGLSENSDR